MIEAFFGPCDPTSCAAMSGGMLAFYGILLWTTRKFIGPVLMPVTYKKLASEPGGQGYWDSSFVALINGFVNVGLALHALWREPRLFTASSDAYLTTDSSCAMIVIFMTWCVIDLSQVWYYKWTGQAATFVHHISAIVAWSLYLEGGYGHGLSLVGVLCEATNPFMNIRYFLSAAGLKSHKAYVYNGVAFCVSWLLVRILFTIPFGSFLIVSQWEALGGLPAWRRWCFAGFFGIGCFLNCMWGFKLFQGAYKIVMSKSE